MISVLQSVPLPSCTARLQGRGFTAGAQIVCVQFIAVSLPYPQQGWHSPFSPLPRGPGGSCTTSPLRCQHQPLRPGASSFQKLQEKATNTTEEPFLDLFFPFLFGRKEWKWTKFYPDSSCWALTARLHVTLGLLPCLRGLCSREGR